MHQHVSSSERHITNGAQGTTWGITRDLRLVQRDAHEKSNAGERVRPRERGSQPATMMTVVKHPTEIRWDKKRGRRRRNQLPLMKSRYSVCGDLRLEIESRRIGLCRS
ncbi:hypothetical protein Hanom_Chr12g01089881 [Helianthus anomalus]